MLRVGFEQLRRGRTAWGDGQGLGRCMPPGIDAEYSVLRMCFDHVPCAGGEGLGMTCASFFWTNYGILRVGFDQLRQGWIRGLGSLVER